MREQRQGLRQHLRAATASLHDRLDSAMRPPADWQSREQYARFLNSQYHARGAVEEWLANHAPSQLNPPAQLPLLAKDLRALGSEIPEKRFGFTLENEGAASIMGAAWVLAGSSLGNRTMLREMRRALPGHEHLPEAFLSSSAMIDFWQNLRPRIEAPHATNNEEIAVRAANRVFHHFLSVAETMRPQATAQDIA